MTAWNSLVDLARDRAQGSPDRIAYTFLRDSGREQLTYGELDANARAIAATLIDRGLRGERVLILEPPGLGFLATFFGCLYAGVIAVPAYVPSPRRDPERLLAMLADASARAILSDGETERLLARLRERTPALSAVPWLCTDQLESLTWQPANVPSGQLAFLQYTSGSTSSPRGVMVTHRHLLENLASIRAAFGCEADKPILSWLPPYHDMGLIGGLLQPLFVGAPATLMAPVRFLQQPIEWLRAISDGSIAISGGPTFGYELCVRRVKAEQLEGLDLRSWQVAFCGAEVVRAETLDRFAELFGPYGFRREAFYPCYGLAESTLLVSSAPAGRGARTLSIDPAALQAGRLQPARDGVGRRLVSCGVPRGGLEVAVVNAGECAPCADGVVGEIWVRGSSVAGGYWNNAERTQQTFGGRLTTDGAPFLRTGDLGVRWDGELWLTGREKDLMIIRGKNHYPDDIEQTASRAHRELRPAGAAAFAIAIADEEQLVVIHEVERNVTASYAHIVQAIRAAIASDHGIVAHAICLLRPGTLPKTTSGKVQRHACRDGYLHGSLAVVYRDDAGAPPAAESGPRERIALELARLWPTHIDASGSVVLDSLAAVEVQAYLQDAFGATLELDELLGEQSMPRLIARVLERERATPAHRDADDHDATDFPLSAGQAAMWFRELSSPGTSANHLGLGMRLPDGVDAARLERAFRELLAEHPQLRVVFHDTHDGARQRPSDARVEAFVLERRPELGDEEAAAWTKSEIHRPFSLENGPLVRLALLQRERDAYLALSAHHAVVDLWSVGLLVEELGQRYGGAVSPRDAGSRQGYRRFVIAERDGLARGAFETSWTYWRKRLAGAPRSLPLAHSRPPQLGQPFRAHRRSFELGPEITSAVRSLASASRATIASVLLAAYQAFLHRSTGAATVLVGVPAHARRGLENLETIGYCANPVVVRSDVASDTCFHSLAMQTQRHLRDALAHQDLPFPELIERLEAGHDRGRPPLCQAMFSFHDVPSRRRAGLSAFLIGPAQRRLQLGELTVESVCLEQSAHVDLFAMFADAGDRLVGAFEYDAALFDDATIERWVAHFQRFLAELLAAPDRSIHDVELDLADGVMTQFAAQVAGSPEAIAVVCGDERVSYAELDRRASCIAAQLVSLGVGPEVFVGVCLPRTVDLIAALLGIWKAGGAYVPLDPSYPTERLQLMARDSGARIIVADSLGRAAFGASWTYVDPQPTELPVVSAGGVERHRSGHDAAYMIYTSGSTGRPKGVVIEHRNLTNFFAAMRCVVKPGKRWASVTSMSFDISILELLWSLANGFEVWLGSDAAELLAISQATHLQCTPSLATQLIDSPTASLGLSRLEHLLVGGEPLSDALAARLKAAVRHVTNMYGPTETTIWSSCHDLTDVAGAGFAELGQPILDTQIYVLDRAASPVPPRVRGEIYIGGAGVARGYRGEPALTAERFVPDPFSATPGSRMYRTGDAAAWTATGGLEFIGRLDHQVKVRGFRIELGEVEAALMMHDGVREAAVVVREQAGDRTLAGYVAAGAHAKLRVDDLRQHLARVVPGYMIPSSLTILDMLPRTPNGKLDRTALPEPVLDGRQPFVAPRTPWEHKIAGIWCDVLKAPNISVEASFFDYGRSLLAMRLVTRIRAIAGIELPISHFYDQPTIAAVARYIEQRRDIAHVAS